MLRAFRIPISWLELFKRTGREIVADDITGLAAEVSYYFVFALFPALLFLVAIVSFVPVAHLLDSITDTLGRVAPADVVSIVQRQILDLANHDNGGLLTIGMAVTIWSMSSGVAGLMDALNHAYDIEEGRSWWRARLTAILLTLALAVFVVIAFVLVLVGPTLAEKAAVWAHLGPAFAWTWKIIQWPIVFGLVTFAIALVYYFGPDAEQEWIWITPGSVAATMLWLIISLGFKFYVATFGSYNATYGAIAGAIILLLWLYLSALAVLVGAELNAEIEHSSPYGKEPGEKKAGEKAPIGLSAAHQWMPGHGSAAASSTAGRAGREAPEPRPRGPSLPVPVQSLARARAEPRASDWILSGIVLGEMALMIYAKLRRQVKRIAG